MKSPQTPAGVRPLASRIIRRTPIAALAALAIAFVVGLYRVASMGEVMVVSSRERFEALLEVPLASATLIAFGFAAMAVVAAVAQYRHTGWRRVAFIAGPVAAALSAWQFYFSESNYPRSFTASARTSYGRTSSGIVKRSNGQSTSTLREPRFRSYIPRILFS